MIMFFPPRYPADLTEEDSDKFTTTYGRFLDFIRRRFSRRDKLGLPLTIHIAFIIFFLFLFSAVLQDYIGHDPLIRADIRIVNLIYPLRSAILSNVMLFFSDLATWQIVFMGVIVVGFFLFALNLLPYLFALIISVSGGEIIVAIIKNLVQRTRPPSMSALVLEKSFSFPSGHVLVAFSFYGLLTYILYKANKKKMWKTIAISMGIAIIGIIAFSRVYLGVHWPSDVLASLALGAAWISMYITILELQKRSVGTKETATLIGRRFIAIPSILLLLCWFFYIGYFFTAHPLIPQSTLV